MMGRKVKVVTKCGEEHTYTYDQDVATVEIIELKYELQDRLDQLHELYDRGCSGVSCSDCALRIQPSDCALCDTIEAVKKAQGYEK